MGHDAVMGLQALRDDHALGVARAARYPEPLLEGVTPERPASGKLLLRVPPEVHGGAMVAAQAAGMSLNQWAAEALGQAVKRARRHAPA